MLPKEFEKLVEGYLTFLNEKDFTLFEALLADDAIMAKGSTFIGKEEILSCLKSMFDSDQFSSLYFDLLDVSSGMFLEDEAEIILFTQLIQKNEYKEIFIESLRIKKVENEWKIYRIFGLSLEEKEADEENENHCSCGCEH